MNKLVVFGSDGTIFDFKPEESTFDYLLDKLGKGDESRKMQEEYLKKKERGPHGLAARVGLFKGIFLAEVKKMARQFLREKLRPDFQDTVRALKKRNYLVAISTSNPTVPYQILKETISYDSHAHAIDFVFGTELEIDERGMCTGKYIPLVFNFAFEQWYKKKHPDLGKHWTQEPNRYGLTQKLVDIVRDEGVDVSYSWLIGNKVTKVPQAEIIPNVIVFQSADPQIEREASHVVKKGEPLTRILRYM